MKYISVISCSGVTIAITDRLNNKKLNTLNLHNFPLLYPYLPLRVSLYNGKS